MAEKPTDKFQKLGEAILARIKRTTLEEKIAAFEEMVKLFKNNRDALLLYEEEKNLAEIAKKIVESEETHPSQITAAKEINRIITQNFDKNKFGSEKYIKVYSAVYKEIENYIIIG